VEVALVRPVPDSFVGAIRVAGGPGLDVALAREQHRGYVTMLESAGYLVETVASDEHYPDCVFIEDTAVVLGPIALIARSGAPSRRGESGPVAEALSSRFSITAVAAPGTLDGGDVMALGNAVFVGRTRRTNDDGIAQLAAVCATIGLPLTTVVVHHGLHLKSVVLPLDDETVLVTPNSVDEGALHGLRILYEADTERHRCSALPLHDGRLLVTAGAPATADMLATVGFAVVPVDISELQAADGGLTCLSIIIDEP
jgi:dimethylargininase